MNNTTKSYIYAILSIIFWSTSASAFKLALKHINIIQLLSISIITSFIILLIILLAEKKFTALFKHNRNSILNSLLVGLLNPLLYYFILFEVYSILPAQIAQPLNFIWPVMLVILSSILLKTKINLKIIIALLISFTGVFFISIQGNFSFNNWANPKGIILALFSAVIWAMFWILNVKDKKNEISKLFLNFLSSTIIILIVLWIKKVNIFIDTKGTLVSVYIGCFEMGFTFIFWLKALQLANSTEKLSNLIYITPFLSLVVIRLVLRENIHFTTLIGLVFIISGIIFQQYIYKKS